MAAKSTKGGFTLTIPEKFNHFHYIAMIFQIFAIKTDGIFASEEKVAIKQFLGEWVGDENETMEILKETSRFLAAFDEKHSDKVFDLVNHLAISLAESKVFTEDNLRSIISDLEDIATSDGVVHENEKSLIVHLEQIWGL
jgi:uncharacterized membrane protein YebE (DUF533 family)